MLERVAQRIAVKVRNSDSATAAIREGLSELVPLLEAGPKLHSSDCPGGVFSKEPCRCGKAEWDAAKQLAALLDAQLNRFKPADASNVTAMTIYKIVEEVLGKPEE